MIFSTADGAQVACLFRDGKDPLVLLHALGCDGSMWDDVIKALPPNRGLVVPDLRGHGASTLGWRTPSVALWAEDVANAILALPIERPLVAGISMGGYVALALAAAHPGLARAYAFIGTTAEPDDDTGRSKRAAAIATVERRGWHAYLDGMMGTFLNTEDERFTVNSRQLTVMFERVGDAGLPPTLMALAARPDRTPLLPSIAAPTLVVAGSGDSLIPPEKTRKIAETIPGAKFHLLEGAAHLTVLERPRAIAELLATM
ncbi:MAG TPA: alpha/beta fold hydrolase [Candidatus Polarisedimenticolaceae bacterium]|nr:alpha/beta fold hydrolase [Candidatus Polarisedimenticolaceae bacterium]